MTPGQGLGLGERSPGWVSASREDPTGTRARVAPEGAASPVPLQNQGSLVISALELKDSAPGAPA